jgi:hypothetical protein
METVRAYWSLILKGWSAIPRIVDRLADWNDGLDWDTLGPAACVGGGVLLVAMLMFYVSESSNKLDASDQRHIEFWSAFALGGRWVALGAAVTPVVVWAATRR